MSDEFNITIRGNSMEPYFHDGDVLVCRKKGEYKPYIGDIIVFKRANSLICHRVVDICLPYIVTKGDNNLLLDCPIHLNDIMGIVEQKKINPEIIINDWCGEFCKYRYYFEKSDIVYVSKPNFIDAKYYNILLANSVNRTIEKEIIQTEINKNIMIHLGAKLSNFHNSEILVRYDRFDRITPYISFHSSIRFSTYEKVMLIIDRVFLEKDEYFKKIYNDIIV
jgi:signal peptidase I